MFASRNFSIFIICICTVSYCNSTDNQFTPKRIKEFADHLFIEKDYERAFYEYERFLFLTNNTYDDTIIFNTGLCFQYLERYELATELFKNIISQSADSTYIKKAALSLYHSYYLNKQWYTIVEMTPSTDGEFYYYYYAHTMLIDKPLELNFFDSITDTVFLNAIWSIEQERQNIIDKSPVFAGILSASIPGLGKAYYDRNGDALFAFATIIGSGLLSYQALKENRFLLGAISGFASATLYMGSIYGSYLGVKWFNKQQKLHWRIKLDSIKPSISF